MKKFLSFFFAAGLICFMVSCNNEKTESSEKATGETAKGNAMTDKNLAASRAISKAFETGDIKGLDSVVADNFVDHTDMGDKVGRDSLKAMVTMIHSTFKDMKMETLGEVADGDYVYTRMRFTGTGDGKMMPAQPYDMHVIETAKFKDGKAVEHWEFMDIQSVKKMQDMYAPKMEDKSKKGK